MAEAIQSVNEKKQSGKRLIGIVKSLSTAKTVKVKIEKKNSHPLYGKIIKSHKSYLVHNELDDIKVDDEVEIRETKPISKRKKFVLVRKIK